MAPNFSCFNYFKSGKRKFVVLSGLLWTNGTSYETSENECHQFDLDIFIVRFNGYFMIYQFRDHRDRK